MCSLPITCSRCSHPHCLVTPRPDQNRGCAGENRWDSSDSASSGNTTRHQLSRGGDRQLNRAIHTIVLTRLRTDPNTRAYLQRRLAAGKTEREVTRCLKRYVARQIHRTLAQAPATT
ncbi:transposase [Nocardia jiangxiensis]|uniref:Transposase n=1 Tax=Nocardia jiangxiensis TaxID=282685 RepID=A0ABW6SBF9_9NOCA